MNLPEGWVPVFRWEGTHKCVQHETRANRTVCGGRRINAGPCGQAGIGWLDAESSVEAAAELGRRPWCPGCLEGLGIAREVSAGDRAVGDSGVAVGVREGGGVRDVGDGGVRP